MLKCFKLLSNLNHKSSNLLNCNSFRFNHFRSVSCINFTQFEKMTISPTIELTDVEEKVCTLLTDFTKEYNDKLEPKDDKSQELELRVTGGWVRDKLLGSQSHDLDIAINIMSGESFAKMLNSYLKTNYQKYGLIPHSIHKIEKNPEKSKHLETATTKLFDVEVDFVNLRSEEYTSESRIPIVEFGTPEQDALRRDATLNALFYNISKRKIEDFTNRGLIDLKDGILRTPLPPRKTFLDDPLRVLRLIRFASRFNFKIDDEVFKCMADKDINEAFFNKISRERVGVETEKILLGKTPLIGLSLIQKTNIENVIFHWHNDQQLIDFNEHENSHDFALINEVYDNGILHKHLANIIGILKDEQYMKNNIPILHDMLSDSPDFKKMFLLSLILIPFQNLKIIFNIKKKINNKISVTESIIKDGLKYNKNEATLVAEIVDSIEEYDKIVRKFKNDRDSLKRSDIGLCIRSFKGHWLEAHFVSQINALFAGNENILNNYSEFYNFVIGQKLEKAYELKPLIDGKQLCKILEMKPGPWLGKLNDLAIVWQLNNPDKSEEQFIEYMKTSASTVL